MGMGKKPPEFYTAYIKEFWELIFGYIKPLTQKILDEPEYKSKIEESLASTLWGRESNTANGFHHTPIDLFVSNKLFRPFSEIAESYGSLLSIRAYINSFPFRNSSISRVSYLRYHIENYLNEIYVLKERLVSFLKVISRAYKSSPEYPAIFKITESLRSLTEESFKPYVKVRGSHIHQYRYNDSDVSRLSSLDLLMKGSDEEFTRIIKGIFKLAYSEIKRKWRKKTVEDLSRLHYLLNIYCEYLLKILRINDELLLPFHLRERTKHESTK